jgi:hypothetical protein
MDEDMENQSDISGEAKNLHVANMPEDNYDFQGMSEEGFSPDKDGEISEGKYIFYPEITKKVEKEEHNENEEINDNYS